MIIPKPTPIKDILLFVGGAATGLLGALIVSSEGDGEPVRELECEEEEVQDLGGDEGKEGDEEDKEGMTQPAEAEPV